MARIISLSHKSNANSKKIKFEHRLVLSNWMLSLFGVASFEDLAKRLGAPRFDSDNEEFGEEGISNFHQCLKMLIDRPELPDDLLLYYDANIVRHWKRITERRSADGQILRLKYFQYLCLLFTEIYLDRYFRNPDKLLSDINTYAERFNAGDTPQQKALGRLFATGLPKDTRVKPYEPEDLRKLAFLSATGSGKTLLMHVHILQYQHYLKLHGHQSDLNRIILLTPNEGLSRQHRDEFRLSEMAADIFNKDAGGLFAGKGIEIIDINKLRETTGQKTIAVDAFEGNNLVLVDEGHRGTTGAEVGQWMRMRNRLCEKGFSFEYSATFGQAMKASGNKELAHEYAKCILFDYSYKYFYGDGYGKEYRILNLEDDSNRENRRRYLTACLLAFYQQQKMFQDKKDELRRFLIEKPLWIFVGGSVTRKPTKRDVSDVVDILLFLANFVKNSSESIRYLDMLLNGTSGLHANGHELFAGSFTYLGQLGFSGEAAFREILSTLFNSQVSGVLHVRKIKGGIGAEGEIALHIGEGNAPFGVINVGDPSGLSKLCEKHSEFMAVSDSEFSESLFNKVELTDSKINVLIGSRKFSEGWSSWRVSTMGLMNIGKKEGSQIIQLFGRGVRLKGLDFCLKRSYCIAGTNAPKDIERLETLNVFGVRANYMQKFKEYLKDEGLPANEERIEFVLPVVKNLGKKPLKIIRLKDDFNYKKQGPKPTLALPSEQITKRQVVVDWYPRIQTLVSARGQGQLDVAERNEEKFEPGHLAFLDVDELYFNLQQFKNEHALYNMNLSKEIIPELLMDSSWYTLYIPKEEMSLKSFAQTQHWQEITTVLLRKYCDRFYKERRAAAEAEHLEYRDLTESDDNFIDDYLFLIDQSRQDIVTKLEEIKKVIDSGQLKSMEMFQGIHPILFGQHLYQPLIYVNNSAVEVKPVILNEGERDFVLDLQQFCKRSRDYFENKELYLLRNMSRGRGVGFFEAGNFYPDFILWLLADGKQYINFIDPKGIRNQGTMEDPKIEFYRTIKSIEGDLQTQDSSITLNSFVVSNTKLLEIPWRGSMTKEQFEEHHVLFQQEDKSTYIEKLLKMAVS